MRHIRAFSFGWGRIRLTIARLVARRPDRRHGDLSMAAYFSGVVQAPRTALVIVTAMTGNRSLTLPLIAAVLIARGASALVCRQPLYRTLADRFMPAQVSASGEERTSLFELSQPSQQRCHR
jgi:H+/Cl- antiporter ClcA